MTTPHFNSRYVIELVYLVATTELLAAPVTMGKLLTGVYGESAAGNSRLRDDLKLIVNLFEGKSFVLLNNKGKRNQSVRATPLGITIAKAHPQYEETLAMMKQWVAEDLTYA